MKRGGKVARTCAGAKITGRSNWHIFSERKIQRDVISCKRVKTSLICVAPAKEESRKLGRSDVRYVRRIPAKVLRRERERKRGKGEEEIKRTGGF